MFTNKAILHLENSVIALNRAQVLAPLFSDGVNGLQNGKADAFRHAFWNALGTAEFGAFKMKLFADAHEYGDSNQPPIQEMMDLFNNQKGRDIAENNNFDFNTTNITISNAIEQAVYNGLLKYIKNGSLVFTNQ